MHNINAAHVGTLFWGVLDRKGSIQGAPGGLREPTGAFWGKMDPFGAPGSVLTAR